MIFNKNNNGSDELRTLTGNYYKSNNFEKVTTQIDLATEDLNKITGKEIYDLAETAYKDGSTVEVEKQLVQHVQLPIALLSTLRMYQRNDISHEDTGRRNKVVPDTEKLPWEWQLDRDDKLHLDDYFKAVDRLISFLDSNEDVFDVWKNSASKKAAHSLFIQNAAQFDEYYPIEKSGRMYMLLLPFIREAHRRYIKKALGEDYDRFIAGTDLTDDEKTLISEYVCPPIPLIALSIAMNRLPLGLIPFGVVRNYTSSSQTMNASEPASIEDVVSVSNSLMRDAMDLLNDLKTQRNPGGQYQLIPNNSRCNKYMSV